MSGALNIGLDASFAGIAPRDREMEVRRIRSVPLPLYHILFRMAPDTQRRGQDRKYEGNESLSRVGVGDVELAANMAGSG